MLKLLLILGVTLLLLACGKTVLAKKSDKYIWLKTHFSYPNKKPYWKKNELTHKTYFGKYTYFNDIFNDYYGDPLGPIVAIWSVTKYLGNEPAFKDCGKKPIWNPNSYKSNTQAYKDSEKQWDIENKQRQNCIKLNNEIEEKSKTITYYYARSNNNYLPVLPKRPENHALYDIHISFGPMGGIVERGLTEKEKTNKNQLYSEPCHRYGKDDTCYRLAGENSHLYYTIRSVLKTEDIPSNKKASAAWKPRKFIREEPHTWQEIKGIEITKAQYEYMQQRCKGVFNCYLDDKAPELNTEQKSYIKAAAWDIDTDEEALKALIKKSKKYQGNVE